METLDFETALRRLIDDASSNFSKFRGAMREPGPVIVIFDGTFAVEGSAEAYVHLLDYEYPRARIEEYSGESEADAMAAFERCVARIAHFCESSGVRRDERVDDELVQSANRQRWFEHIFEGTDQTAAHIVVHGVGTLRPGEPENYYIWTEVIGWHLECVDGSPPDQSMWAILMGHRYRKRAGGPQRNGKASYRRRRQR